MYCLCMAITAETFQPDRGQSLNPTGELPGLRVLAIFKGPHTLVPHESRPGYFRRVTPQPVVVERTSTTTHPNETPGAPGE